MIAFPDVQVGDEWADNDPRGGPRVRVEKVCGYQSACPGPYQPHAHVVTVPGDKGPRTIRLVRFRSTRRNGYRLISRPRANERCVDASDHASHEGHP